MVETWPYLQICSITEIVKAFELDDSSLLDHWHGEWKTIRISMPIMVEKGQRVLLRLRPGLREHLTDCPGLKRELQLQPKRPSGMKRAAETLVSPIKKVVRTDKIPSPVESTHKSTPSLSFSSPSTPTIPHHFALPSPSQKLSVTSPGHTKEKDRKWPFDFYVCEIAYGLCTIRGLMDKNSKKTWKDLVPEVFHTKYVKTTFIKYRDIFDKAPMWLRLHFEHMDKSPKALWPKFKDALAEVKSGLLTEADVMSDSDGDDVSIDSHIATKAKPSEKDVFEKLAEYPTYNVGDPQLDAQIAAVHKRIAAIDTILAESDNHGIPDMNLCPFCDEPLPSSPTDKLLALRKALDNETWPDPTPLNPNHRNAKSWIVTQEFCTLHEFEVDNLPVVRQEGWPLHIEFASLHTRIFKWRRQLRGLLANPQGNAYFQATKTLWESFPSNACGMRNQYAAFQGGSAG
jgi:hypothetical protein